MLALCTGAVANGTNASSVRAVVEHDWLCQDISRIRQLWYGGLVYAKETQVRCAGLTGGERCLPIPNVADAPSIDGRLADPCWAQATRIYSPVVWTPAVAGAEGCVLLCRQADLLFVGLSTSARDGTVFTYGPVTVRLRSDSTVAALRKGKPVAVTARAERVGSRTLVEVALSMQSPARDRNGIPRHPLFAPLVFALEAGLPELADIVGSGIRLEPGSVGMRWERPRDGRRVSLDLTGLEQGSGHSVTVEVANCTREKITVATPSEGALNAGGKFDLALGRPREGATVASLELSLSSESAREIDAAGAVDGVKNGGYGFHTAPDDTDPWWQVDLDRTRSLDYVLVYNRADGTASRARRLVLLTSQDGVSWVRRYQHHGSTFQGFPDRKPLRIGLEGTRARYVRIQLPGRTYLHLDEVEVYGTETGSDNLALNRSAKQSSAHAKWSKGIARIRDGFAFYVEPLSETLAAGRQLAVRLGDRAAAERLDAVGRRATLTSLGSPAWRSLYLEARRLIREAASRNPLLDFDRLLFVTRGNPGGRHMVDQVLAKNNRHGGDLCILSPVRPDGTATALLGSRLGEPQVKRFDLSADASKAVFACAPGDERFYHIYEMGIDGAGLRQITRGSFDDIDPCYLPNGKIFFMSTRNCGQIQCGARPLPGPIAHSMNADGSGIQRLSANKECEWFPSMLSDGRVLYTRWEYVDTPTCDQQGLWTMGPDGSMPLPYFAQHMGVPQCLMEAAQVPGSSKVVFTSAPHHDVTQGSIYLLDARYGIDEPAGLTRITAEVGDPERGYGGAGGYYRSPWPLSEDFFLVSYSFRRKSPMRYGLYLVDAFGNKELVYRDPVFSCYQPVPLEPRSAPAVLAHRPEPEQKTGTLYVEDVYHGLEGVERGRVKHIRLIEPVPTPYLGLGISRQGIGMNNFFSRRILGTVPIEPDGSAHFIAPADRAFYFQLVDADFRVIQSMRSFANVRPGEVRGCIGCHYTRDETPRSSRRPLALRRPPSELTPSPFGDEAINFLKHIQPILDRHCTKCHSGFTPKAGLSLSGGPTRHFNRAYESLASRKVVKIIDLGPGFSTNPRKPAFNPKLVSRPLSFGSHVSKLITMLDAGHNKVKLDALSRRMLIEWVDANAPYYPQNPCRQVSQALRRAPSRLAAIDRAIHTKRCGNCHAGAMPLARLEWLDLARPERSLFLAAPLASEAGGLGRCKADVYQSTSDPDYQRTLQGLLTLIGELTRDPRRDFVGVIVSEDQWHGPL